MPEWTGTILTWAEASDELTIQLGDVTEENLGAYFDALEAAGWTVSRFGLEGSASKGLANAYFYQQGNTTVQLAILQEKEGTWPSDRLPPDIYPPENCTLVGNPDVWEEEEDSLYTFHFTCEGVDVAAANAYLAGLEQEGWDGPGQYFKDIEWQGKTWTADIELYDTYGTRSEFSGNLSAQ